MTLFGKHTLLALVLLVSSQAVSSDSLTREGKLFRSIETGEGEAFVKAQRIEMPVGFSAPMHSHPVPTFGIINKGVILYQEDGEKEVELREGDTFFEPKNANIVKFNNVGDDVAAFTVFYIVDDENASTVKIQKAP